MIRWTPVAFAALLAASVVVTGCESTQDKAKKLQAEGDAAVANQQSLQLNGESKDVKVVDSTLLHDKYGDAVVVELENSGKQPLANLPILVDLRDGAGKSVYKNDTPGLDPSLNHVPLLEPGEKFTWINDQVQPTGMPKTAKVTVGTSSEQVPAQLPQIDVGDPEVDQDVSGIEARGPVTNKSKIDQQKLIVYVTATSGGKVVAAGRGLIKNLKVGKPVRYRTFFIGDPKGGDLTVEAPPTTLK